MASDGSNHVKERGKRKKKVENRALTSSDFDLDLDLYTYIPCSFSCQLLFPFLPCHAESAFIRPVSSVNSPCLSIQFSILSILIHAAKEKGRRA